MHRLFPIIKSIFSGSWKTTSAGLVCIILLILANFDLVDKDTAKEIAMIVLGIGFIGARDNNKTSESVGAK
jgi:hypothetical protein